MMGTRPAFDEIMGQAGSTKPRAELAALGTWLADTPAAELRRTLVTVMEAVLRDTDLLIEGDERRRLRILMPGTPLRNAPLAAERLLAALAGQDPAMRDRLAITWLGLNQAEPKGEP